MLQLLDDPFGDLVESGPRAAAATVAGESVMPVVPLGPVMPVLTLGPLMPLGPAPPA